MHTTHTHREKLSIAECIIESMKMNRQNIKKDFS